MKKYGKLILAAAAFVLFMAAVSAAYTGLSKDYKPKQNLASSDTSGTETDTPEETENTGTEAGAQDTAQQEKVKAVDFTVENDLGEGVNLLSLVGKPIVLNFWASWCGPCKSELPDFQAAWENYESEIEFVMVNMTDGSRETKEIAAAFWTDGGYTMPVFFDTASEAAYTYGVTALPTTLFINADAEIVAWAQGMIDADTLELGISMIQ